MISFNYENDFLLDKEDEVSNWILSVIRSENCKISEINYVFCDDNYLHKLNTKFLNHDTLTDIISFDYSVGNILKGDIYISTERVKDNALDYNVDFSEELRRVIIHGILHYCGYKDKLKSDAQLMREKENLYLNQFK